MERLLPVSRRVSAAAVPGQWPQGAVVEVIVLHEERNDRPVLSPQNRVQASLCKPVLDARTGKDVAAEAEAPQTGLRP